MVQAQKRGRHAARDAAPRWRLSRLRGERRHHRAAAERGLGSLGPICRAIARDLDGDRHLHAAPDRPEGPRPGVGRTVSLRRRDRRLRADRPEACRGARAGARSSPAPIAIASARAALARRRPARCACRRLARAPSTARRRHRRSSRRRTTRSPAIARGRASRPASTCWSRSRRRAPSRELDASSRRPQAHGGWCASASTTAIIRRCSKARELVDAGALGPLMFVRGRYGHGGRLGYEREWRADPARVGRRRADRPGRAPDRPGALVPRRLRRTSTASRTPTSGTCRSTTTRSCCCGRPAARRRSCTSSCTEWKNLFSLEIYGRDGKLHDRRARRQLRRRAADVLSDAARDGPAGDDRSGSIPARDRSWATRVRRVPRGHPARTPAERRIWTTRAPRSTSSSRSTRVRAMIPRPCR